MPQNPADRSVSALPVRAGRQSAFTKPVTTLLEISVRTLQDWEQGRRREPIGIAKTLLRVAMAHPDVLCEVSG